MTIRHSIPNKEVDLMLMADAPSLKDWRETILARFRKTDDKRWLFHPKAVREYDHAHAEHDRNVANVGAAPAP